MDTCCTFSRANIFCTGWCFEEILLNRKLFYELYTTVFNIIEGPTIFVLEYSVFLWVKQDPHPTPPPSLPFSRYMQLMVSRCKISVYSSVTPPISSKSINHFCYIKTHTWGCSTMNNTFPLFYSPKPQSQEWILIYRKWSIWKQNQAVDQKLITEPFF